MTISWRGKKGGVTCIGVTAEGKATSVAKGVTCAGSNAERAADFANLGHFGPEARAAGAMIPYPQMQLALADQEVFIQSTVGGTPAVARLMASRRSLLPLLDKVTQWLQRWHAATRVIEPLSEAHLWRWLSAPAAQLGGGGGEDTAYQRWLEAKFAPLIGTPLPMVVAHNDLTMWNLLVDEKGELGIVDWEAAQAHSLPLVDFFYCAVDAVAAISGYRSRLAAVQSCFVAGGVYARTFAKMRRYLQEAVELDPALAGLCFHACWLHHACNEDKAVGETDPRPFLEIVQWLATHGDSIDF